MYMSGKSIGIGWKNAKCTGKIIYTVWNVIHVYSIGLQVGLHTHVLPTSLLEYNIYIYDLMFKL